MSNYTPKESITRVRENAEMPLLADIYEYCYENLEEWEKGEIEPTDLPHVGSRENDVFSKFTGALILRSIAFGCSWEEHVPSDRNEVSETDV